MSQSTSWWRRSRRRPLLVGAGVLAVGAVAGAVWFGSVGASGDETAGAAGPTPTAAADPSPTTPPAEEPVDSGASATPAPPSGGAVTPADPASAADSTTPDQQPVAPREVVVLPPVGLADSADFGNEVTARLVTTSRVDGTGQGIGERSGPAMLLSIEITNGSAADIDLDYLVVNLYGPENAPGQLLLGDTRSAPMSGVLAAGQSRTGTYVLRLPDPDALSVNVEVSYGADTPTAVFAGDVAT